MKFIIDYPKEKNNQYIGVLQLDPEFPVDENDIKHNLLLNCNETKIYRDLNNDFKKNLIVNLVNQM